MTRVSSLVFRILLGSFLLGGRLALAAEASCQQLFSQSPLAVTRQELIKSKSEIKELAQLRIQLEGLDHGPLQSQVLQTYREGREQLVQRFGDQGIELLDSEIAKARIVHEKQILRDQKRQQLQEQRRQRQAEKIAKRRFQRLLHHHVSGVNFDTYLNQREAIFLDHGVFVLYDFVGRKKLLRIEDSRIRATDNVVAHPNGLVAFILTGEEILAFDRQTGQLTKAADNVSRYSLGANAMSRDGSRLMVSGVIEARVFDVKGTQLIPVQVSQEFPQGSDRVEMSSDGRFVSISGGRDLQAIYDLETKQCIPIPVEVDPDRYDYAIYFSGDSRSAWVKQHLDRWVQFELLTGKIIRQVDIPELDSVSVNLSEDHQWIVEYSRASSAGAAGVVFTAIHTLTGQVVNWQRPLRSDEAYGLISFDLHHNKIILPEQRFDAGSRTWALRDLHIFDLDSGVLESNPQPAGRTFNYTSSLSPSGRSLFLHNSFQEFR